MDERTNRPGPFRLKLWLLLVGLFILRLTFPDTQSTTVEAAARGTNHTDFLGLRHDQSPAAIPGQ